MRLTQPASHHGEIVGRHRAQLDHASELFIWVSIASAMGFETLTFLALTDGDGAEHALPAVVASFGQQDFCNVAVRATRPLLLLRSPAGSEQKSWTVADTPATCPGFVAAAVLPCCGRELRCSAGHTAGLVGRVCRWVGPWGVIVWVSVDIYRAVGSRIRFEALFRDHAAAVRVYAARRAGLDDADDVVAEVFLIAWRRIDDLPEDPRSWLLGVARRVLANRRRGEARRAAMHDRLVGGVPGAVGGRVAQVSDGVVAAALARLGERDREVLLLTAWEGLGHADAARVLGIRTGTLTVRLHRARRRFARILADAERVPSTQAEVEVL